jgi:pSer/pThr/pTyr-binding forkhead associated (FHA) protein
MANELHKLGSGGVEEKIWDLDEGPVTFGRDVSGPQGVKFDDHDTMVSKEHARVEKGWFGQFVIKDLKSANGTVVNGEYVRKRVLGNGDFIEIGRHRFRICLGGHVQGATLEMTRGPIKGKSWSLDNGPVHVGRGVEGANDILLPEGETSVSERHAVFTKEQGQYKARDLGSKNGILINGQPVRGKGKLKNKDLIDMGAVRFRILIR